MSIGMLELPIVRRSLKRSCAPYATTSKARAGQYRSSRPHDMPVVVIAASGYRSYNARCNAPKVRCTWLCLTRISSHFAQPPTLNGTLTQSPIT
jgi:hypothetical protein